MKKKKKKMSSHWLSQRLRAASAVYTVSKSWRPDCEHGEIPSVVPPCVFHSAESPGQRWPLLRRHRKFRAALWQLASLKEPLAAAVVASVECLTTCQSGRSCGGRSYFHMSDPPSAPAVLAVSPIDPRLSSVRRPH